MNDECTYWDDDIAWLNKECELMGMDDQTEDTCICTIDKDLWTVPGWHYDFRIDYLDWVNEKEAEYHLQYQLHQLHLNLFELK